MMIIIVRLLLPRFKFIYLPFRKNNCLQPKLFRYPKELCIKKYKRNILDKLKPNFKIFF